MPRIAKQLTQSVMKSHPVEPVHTRNQQSAHPVAASLSRDQRMGVEAISDALPERTAGGHRFAALNVNAVPGNPARGRLLDSPLRQLAESRLGGNFGQVTIEENVSGMPGDAAAQGQHLRFAQGAFKPHDIVGRGLLLHELAHVQQQQRGIAVDAPHGPDSALESEAHERGARATLGLPLSALPFHGGGRPTGAAQTMPIQYGFWADVKNKISKLFRKTKQEYQHYDQINELERPLTMDPDVHDMEVDYNRKKLGKDALKSAIGMGAKALIPVDPVSWFSAITGAKDAHKLIKLLQDMLNRCKPSFEYKILEDEKAPAADEPVELNEEQVQLIEDIIHLLQQNAVISAASVVVPSFVMGLGRGVAQADRIDRACDALFDGIKEGDAFALAVLNVLTDGDQEKKAMASNNKDFLKKMLGL